MKIAAGDPVRIVLDTSAAANLVLATPQAERLVTVLDAAQLVLAPTLLHSELANTLWKSVRFAGMSLDTALSRYEEALSLVDEFVPDSQVMHQALQMAATHQHPVYDMVFLALAQRYACRLLSTDSKLLALAARIDPNLAVPD